MTNKNKFLIEKTKEKALSSSKRVYSKTDLTRIYYDINLEWVFPKQITPNKYFELVIKSKLFKEIIFKSPYNNLPKRYCLGDFSIYELALSIQKDAYLSHGTAAFLHGLIDRKPDTIYLNKEQSIKPHPEASLTQEALNRAFEGKQRKSKYVIQYKTHKITLLNGKNTGRSSVKKITGERGEVVELTDMERTLVDITVRPVYIGGIRQVLNCYIKAKNRISPQKLIKLLDDLDYVYPYHQAVGFYMQKAGFPKATWTELRNQKQNYDFFLAHGIKKKFFDPNWRIYIPIDL